MSQVGLNTMPHRNCRVRGGGWQHESEGVRCISILSQSRLHATSTAAVTARRPADAEARPPKLVEIKHLAHHVRAGKPANRAHTHAHAHPIR